MARAADAPVAVLFGGTSAEHGVSLKSGATIVRGLRRAGYDVVPVVIARDGTWSIVGADAATGGFGGAVPSAPAGAERSGSALETTLELKRRGVDVAILGLHGPGGEDGSLQGFLQVAGLRYSGPGVAASAVAMDKLLLKRVLRGSGLPTAEWCEISEGGVDDAALSAAIDRAATWANARGYPAVVKATTLGSSVGVAIARDETSLRAACRTVAAEGVGLFVESGLAGPEVSCAVFGRGAEARALPAIEIVPRKAGWFDFASKYEPGGAIERIPAQISPDAEARVREIALATHRAIGADGVTRTDFIVTADGPVVLETNTLPGMTETSLVPQEAAAVGWSLEELLRRIVENARARR
ncbi:MAG TPA: D-alanine--D-alanine ligase [Planctomycetota bacterium]|nr:D-alanine--D-alanine ligase [Planctomycetota bacterium]